MTHATPPIMLSVCIPAYSRQDQLAHNLEQMQWMADADITIEVIVSDDASVDETERVIQEKGRMFPHFRYVRQPKNIGPENNFIAAMRLARGKFFVELADDDRLIQETVLSEIDYMNRHEDIIASHAPWLVWSDITQTDHGLFYHLAEPVSFGKEQSADLFNFLVSHQIFPEHAICRTHEFTKVLFRTHGVLKEFYWNFRALEYGRIRFQPKPWLLHVGESPIPSAQREKLGVKTSITKLDDYRAGIEVAASMAMTNVGMTDFTPDNRAVVLDLINDFAMGRIGVAARIAERHGDYIGAAEFLKRRLLWAKTEADKHYIRDQEQIITPNAVFQAVGEIFAITVDVHHLVLCGIPDSESAQARFRQIVPGMPTVIREVSTALKASDRQQCVYLVEEDETSRALQAAGVEAGKIMVMSELLKVFRVIC